MISLKWPRRRSARLCIVLAVAAVFVVLAVFRKEFSPRPAPIAAAIVPEPAALAPGLYCLGKTAPAAVYMVETSKGLVLIDSGPDGDGVGVLRQMGQLGFDVLPPGYFEGAQLTSLQAILLTHVHVDHSQGAEALRAMTGAKVYAGRGDAAILRSGTPREAFISTFYLPRLHLHPTTVDVELDGGEAIEFGETRFTALMAPGHTPGSVCYLMERSGLRSPPLRALFAGDVIQNLDVSRTDALGTYAAYLSPRYRGDARAYLASLRQLRDLPAPDLVLPGHPSLSKVPLSPRIDEKRWHALLGRGIADMERLVARFEADGAGFLDGTPCELLPGLHYLGDLSGFAVYCLAAPSGLIVIGAPGGPKLSDFLGAQLKKAGIAGRKLTAVLLTSVDEEAISGLAGLVRQSGCRVVAAAAGREVVRRRCPVARVISAKDLAKESGLAVEAIPLAGRGLAPVAYRLPWAGKTILFSGRMPMKLSTPVNLKRPEIAELYRLLHAPGGSAADYLKSLDRLVSEKPDLWLPALPVQGQNAYLYAGEWNNVLENNRELVRVLRKSSGSPQ